MTVSVSGISKVGRSWPSRRLGFDRLIASAPAPQSHSDAGRFWAAGVNWVLAWVGDILFYAKNAFQGLFIESKI